MNLHRIIAVLRQQPDQGSAGTRHAFRVDSDTARFLNGYTPASMEALVIERGVPTAKRVLPPRNVGPPPVMESVLPGRYGLDALPCPDPLRPERR